MILHRFGVILSSFTLNKDLY
ncbi:hypothetical protein Goarm_003675 [Gossypium armourianum]|uniref:Uncharacterized protein n=1 Tax=Gossypium armourianum TaxID=34283 RepID=A0A7J9K469_9ROSI|nr:hypothetical protein [Gossypium armourianum]MBA0833744.1 hypothetical protein [Gossypium armourianum]MBA0841166.1 hypothetical protein [Gossypium armourianum]